MKRSFNKISRTSLRSLILIAIVGAQSFAASASTQTSMQNDLDREINKALSSGTSGSSVRTVRTTRRVVKRPVAQKYKQVSINSFSDTSTNIDRIRDEVGSQKPARTSTYDELINSSNSLRSDDLNIERQRAKKFGFNLYTFFSNADSLVTTGNSLSRQQTSFSQYNSSAFANGQYSTSAAYGFGLEHSNSDLMYASSVGLGYSLGATYEFNRVIDRGYINRTNGQSVKANDPSLSLVLPYANVLMTYGTAYFLVGLNYSVPQMADAADEIYQGALGYQIGAGMELGNYMALEATYRWVNFSASVKKDNSQFVVVNQDSYSRQGLGLLADEQFQLNGINVSLKVRF